MVLATPASPDGRERAYPALRGVAPCRARLGLHRFKPLIGVNPSSTIGGPFTRDQLRTGMLLGTLSGMSKRQSYRGKLWKKPTRAEIETKGLLTVQAERLALLAEHFNLDRGTLTTAEGP